MSFHVLYRENRQGLPGFVFTPSNIPIVVFPGIFGDGSEVAPLAAELYKKSQKQRSIFTYYNPRGTDPRLLHEPSTLFTHIQNIVADVLAGPVGQSPFIDLVGYSYGSIESALVASELQKMGYHVSVHSIDGVAPETAKQYFAPHNAHASRDLITILNVAAIKSGLGSIAFQSSDVDNLGLFPLETQLTNIQQHILANQQEFNEQEFNDRVQRFNAFVEIVRQNLLGLSQYHEASNDSQKPLDEVYLYLTNETVKKHGPNAGWDQFAQKLHFTTGTSYSPQAHTDLVRPEHSAHIAEAILARKIDMGTFQAKLKQSQEEARRLASSSDSDEEIHLPEDNMDVAATSDAPDAPPASAPQGAQDQRWHKSTKALTSLVGSYPNPRRYPTRGSEQNRGRYLQELSSVNTAQRAKVSS